MQKIWQAVGGLLVAICWVFVMMFPVRPVIAGDFLADTVNPLLSEWWWGDERAYNIEEIKDDASLVDNLKELFYPEDGDGGALWDLLRYILAGVLVLLFVWTGAQLLFYANNEEEVQKNLMNLLYIILWSIIVFSLIWLLGDAINLATVSWLSGWEESIVQRAEGSIFLIALSAMKAIAFFVAVVFLVYFGYNMVTAFDASEKLAAAKKWIINVVIALLFIKVIDFLYFMALQSDLRDRAIDFIVQASKFLGYFIGIAVVILIMYAGFRMVTSVGDEEQVKKAQNTVRTIFVVFIVLMLFLLIIYQILNDVVGT